LRVVVETKEGDGDVCCVFKTDGINGIGEDEYGVSKRVLLVLSLVWSYGILRQSKF